MKCIAFDVNGTLVGNKNSEDIIIILKCLCPHYKIIVWSNAGGKYAKSVVDKLKINQYISSCRDKDDVRIYEGEEILMTVDDDKDFNYSLFNLKV